MRTFARMLALCSLALACASPAARAQNTLTITCTDSKDGVKFNANVYQLYFDVSAAAAPFRFAIYTDLSKFNEAVNDEFFLSATPFNTCTFSPSNGTEPENISIEDVSANVTPQGNYTLITFNAEAILLGPNTPSIKAPSTTTPLTADEKAKSLAAFKAGIPPLVLPKK